MAGLANILKLHGKMSVTGSNGKEVVWVWDYAQNRARVKSEMTRAEILASNEARKRS